MTTTPEPSFPSGEAETLPDAFMQSVRSFQESRILLSALELDLFTAVGAGRTPADVAAAAATDPRGTDILLHALAAMGLVEKRDGRFFNGPLAERFLRAGAPHDWRAALMHSAALWHRWTHLTECVRTGTPAPRGARSEAEIESFIAAMHHNATARATGILRAVDVSGARRLLDVGGGSAGYAIAFARAVPGLTAEVADLEDVTPIAERNIDAAGLSGRVTTRVLDLRNDPLGAGYDLVLISAVCHMLDPDENADLIRRSAAALERGGRLLMHDYVLDPDRTGPRAGALFSVNMLVNTAGGRDYSEREYRGWMAAAGFTGVQRVPLEGPTALMTGTRA